MGLTEYRALLLDCDGVLVDSDSGVWAALQGLFASFKAAPSRDSVMSYYHEVLDALYLRFDELGFSGMLCFAHRQLAEHFDVRVSWEESLSFARSVRSWPLFEDAPGALLYLRKFYRLLVLCERDAEDRTSLCERLGLGSEEVLVPSAAQAWVQKQGLAAHQVMVVTVADSVGGEQAHCLLRRRAKAGLQTCQANFCVNSLADFIYQHQLSLRR